MGSTPTQTRTRRFDSAGHVVRDAAGLTSALPELWRVYRGGLSPALRERIMVAVSRANACAGCAKVHQRLALRAGVTDEELEELGLDEMSGLDPASRAAVVYAVERSQAGFPGTVGAPCADPEVSAALDAHFTPAEIGQVDAVARGMTFANLSVGTAEALRERIGV